MPGASGAGETMPEQTIALVNMPFASANAPSMQVGLLKAIAATHGIEVAAVYANVEFAARIGVDLFARLSDVHEAQLGEWVFSRAAFPSNTRADALPGRFPAVVAALAAETGTTAARLAALREHDAVAFVAELAERLLADGLRIACFTSTFQQNVASLALARELKRRDPEVFCLFGGANFDGPMGAAYLRAFEWIDAAVVGEADEAFPAVLDAVLAGRRPLPAMPGLIDRSRLDDAPHVERATFTRPLDTLPTPDYGDYFTALERAGLSRGGFEIPVRIPFESARGCWWGEKSHCTFCGVNGLGMGFREKSPSVVIRDLEILARRHRTVTFSAVDNILGPRLRAALTEELPRLGYDLELFYELKANLSREHVRALRNAGVDAVQPGIESLSSRLLTLMGKGIRAIQNVNALRWFRHHGVWARWSLLHGFPGEVATDYAEQAAMIPLLHHLQPPQMLCPVRVERFTPYFDGRAPGFTNLRPATAFELVYPEHLDTAQAAYLFEADCDVLVGPQAIEPLRAAVRGWQERWEADGMAPFLTFRNAPGGLFVDDGRTAPAAPRRLYCEAPLGDVYLACLDRPRSLASAGRALDERGIAMSTEELAAALEAFVAKGLMLREDDLYLALATPARHPHGAPGEVAPS